MLSTLRYFLLPLALIAAGPLSAATATFDFPGATTTQTASAGEFYFNPTHTATDSFTGTGIADAESFRFDLTIASNLKNSAFVTFEARTNMTVLGSFTFFDTDADGLYSFTFSFADFDPIGDDYSVGLFVTNTVPSGNGSIDFVEGSSSLTITGDTQGAVPLPASMFLLAGGVLGLGSLRRKRKAA